LIRYGEMVIFKRQETNEHLDKERPFDFIGQLDGCRGFIVCTCFDHVLEDRPAILDSLQV
jgi:hypothetical protein